MGTTRAEQRIQNLEQLGYTDLHHIMDIAVQAQKNATADILQGGVISCTITPDAPATLYLNISALLGYSKLGEHLKYALSSRVLFAAPTTGSKWSSVFATFSWTYGDLRPDGAGINQYHLRTEDVTFSVVVGSSSSPPANPGGGAIRICSVYLSAGQTQITAGQIITTAPTYQDKQRTFSDLVSDSGDVLTGQFFWSNGTRYFPLTIANSGLTNFSEMSEAGIVSTPGDDWHGCRFCYTPLIRSGMNQKPFHIDFEIKMTIYRVSSGEPVECWVNPKDLMFNTDITMGGIFTQLVFPYYVTDGSDEFTGDFYILGLGPDEYVSRLAKKQIRWRTYSHTPTVGMPI